MNVIVSYLRALEVSKNTVKNTNLVFYHIFLL